MIWPITIAVFIVSVAIFASFAFEGKKAGVVSVCMGELCVKAEVADTAASRARGLMFREGLEEERGMLFVFPQEGLHSFWMKNTKIPLDIVWIGKDLRVVHVEKASPCQKAKCPSYKPSAPARYVLEINQGLCEKHGIKIGDIASIKGL